MKKILAFFLGLVFVVAGVFTLEFWCKSQMKNKRRAMTELRDVEKVEDLKKKYPESIFPEPPPPLPEEKRYKGILFRNMHLSQDVVYLKDMKYHKLSHRHVMKQPDGKVISDIPFFFDQYYRRLVPADQSKKNASNFIAFFGDSNIIGFGIHSDKTLANFVSTKLQHTKIYDYSFVGAYPYEILQRTQNIDRVHEIPEKKGVALYFFFSYHILRNMGGIHELGQRNRADKLSVDMSEDGEILIGDTFRVSRPIWFTLAPYLARSSIVQYFELDLKPRDRDYKVQLALIRKMKKNLADKGINKFFVVIHPMQFSLSSAQKLLPYLKQEGIPFIYMGHWRMRQITEGPVNLIYDMHLSGEANKVMAEGLAAAVKSLP